MLISSISNSPGVWKFKSLEFGSSTVKLCSTSRGTETKVPGPALDRLAYRLERAVALEDVRPLIGMMGVCAWTTNADATKPVR